MTASLMERLLGTHAAMGSVQWLAVRPARGELEVRQCVEVALGAGLIGDRYRGSSGDRAVTLIQFEHLPVIAALLGIPSVDPGILRRNVVVRGISVAGLERARFRVGNVLLEGTGPCHPCSKLDADLGVGGYAAMMGHGGINARVIEAGSIRVGDPVEFLALRPLARRFASKGST